MISIYSIKEIIEASENILSSSAKKKYPISNHDSINDIKMNIENPLILEKKQKIQNQIPKEIEDIISVAEKSKLKIDTKEVSNKNQIIKPMIKEKIKLNDVVDQLYNLFDKKIKKNTLKLIVGLKNEITSLDEKITTLAGGMITKIQEYLPLNYPARQDLGESLRLLSDKILTAARNHLTRPNNKIQLSAVVMYKRLHIDPNGPETNTNHPDHDPNNPIHDITNHAHFDPSNYPTNVPDYNPNNPDHNPHNMWPGSEPTNIEFDPNFEYMTSYFHTKQEVAFSHTNITTLYQKLSDDIIEREETFEAEGSGWVMHRVLNITLTITSFSPLRGSSYIDLPTPIKNKQVCINVKNEDQKCLRWAIKSYLFPIHKNSDRPSSYPTEDGLDFSGIDFPTPITQIKKVEKQNGLAINVFGLNENNLPFPLQLSKQDKSLVRINLLLFFNGPQSHYVWIKNMNG